MRPPIRQLEYFVSVAEEGSFSRAASMCGVSQPGLSAQIRSLEDLLGVTLFERSRPQVLLTDAGRRLLPTARSVLERSDALVAATRSFKEPLTGTLKLGVIPTIAPYLLPEALPQVRRRYPELRLLLHEDKTASLVEAVGDGRLDLALLAIEADLGDLETYDLFKDPFLLAVPPKHRLAGRKRATLKDLEGEDVLLLDDGHCLRDQTIGLCDSGGANEVNDFRASGLSTLAQMVASGVGVTLLPEMSIARESKDGKRLVTIPLSGGESYRTIGLAWRKTSARGEEFRLLGDALKG